MEYAEYKKRIRSLPQLSNAILLANRRLLATVYFRKWSAFSRKEDTPYLENNSVVEQENNTALVVKYLGKLNEYVKIQQSRQQKISFAKTLDRAWKRSLVQSYYHRLLMWRLLNKSKRKSRAIASVMASAQDRAQMVVHMERLVAFSKAERKREQRHQFAVYLGQRNTRLSVGGFFHKWMLWSTQRRAALSQSHLSAILVNSNTKQQLHSYFRKWMVWRMAKQIRRLTQAYAEKEENGRVLQMCIEEQKDLSDDMVTDTYYTVHQKYTSAQNVLDQLHDENSILVQHQRSLEKEKQILLPLGQGGVVGVYNAMHILKAKFLNFNTDFKLIMDIREKTKRITPMKLFQTSVNNFKHYMNETARLPANSRPGKYNAYAQQCIKEMAITFDMLPFEGKESLSSDEELSQVMISVFNVVDSRAR